MCAHMLQHMWMANSVGLELVLSFHLYMGSGVQPDVIWLVSSISKSRYQLSQLISHKYLSFNILRTSPKKKPILVSCLKENFHSTIFFSQLEVSHKISAWKNSSKDLLSNIVIIINNILFCKKKVCVCFIYMHVCVPQEARRKSQLPLEM